jgi:hypothetical protein
MCSYFVLTYLVVVEIQMCAIVCMYLQSRIFRACSFTLMTRNPPISIAEPPLDADRQLTPVSLRIIPGP